MGNGESTGDKKPGTSCDKDSECTSGHCGWTRPGNGSKSCCKTDTFQAYKTPNPNNPNKIVIPYPDGYWCYKEVKKGNDCWHNKQCQSLDCNKNWGGNPYVWRCNGNWHSHDECPRDAPSPLLHFSKFCPFLFLWRRNYYLHRCTPMSTVLSCDGLRALKAQISDVCSASAREECLKALDHELQECEGMKSSLKCPEKRMHISTSIVYYIVITNAA